MMIKQFPDSDIAKGRMLVDQRKGFKREQGMTEDRQIKLQQWARPADNELKLNVDGAFSTDGRAGIGMVLRDRRGAVLFAACQPVQHCHEPMTHLKQSFW
jgi:hypothetical protein